MNYITQASLMEPIHLTSPAPWAGHIPFAAWLISIQRPNSLVELGAYSGISYLAFCQAILEQGLPTQAFAVDTWQGDEHAGAYDETIYHHLKQAHHPRYSSFSNLLRMTFDEALSRFPEASIDLLHIDGLHTYEAVRHDFETWRPKLSGQGVVLFHDTNVFKDDFGVHRLWAELATQYPSFQFLHSNGLGVLLVGTHQPPELLKLCTVPVTALQQKEAAYIQHLFASIGARLERRAELFALQNQLKDALDRENNLNRSGEQRHQWIQTLDQKIIELNQHDARMVSSIDRLNAIVSQRDATVNQLESTLSQRDATVIQLESTISLRDATFSQLESTSRRDQQHLDLVQKELQSVYLSRSWRLTAGVRNIATRFRRIRSLASRLTFRRANQAFTYLRRGEWRALRTRVSGVAAQQAPLLHRSGARQIGILTTEHTMYVAHLLVNALNKIGMKTQIFTGVSPAEFDLGLYLVLAPQMFKTLPPGEKRIVVQMEQNVSSRWFTLDYLHTLEHSLAVFDYAQSNLRYLQDRGIGYPHTYLVPVGGFTHYRDYLQRNEPAQEDSYDKTCDVLFYGATNAARRTLMLNELKKHFNVRVEGNLFGSALRRALLGARVVVNIHFYEGALLETTRIFECMSLGIPVVSEVSSDMAEHTDLQQAVRFVPVGDSGAMIAAVRDILAPSPHASELTSSQRDIAAAVAQSELRFQFMFYRALYALKMIDHDEWQRLTQNIPLPGNRLALSMPETTVRRLAFEQVRPVGVSLFDGVRQHPGWIGCGLSYQLLARQAVESAVDQLEVMEDDVLFPADYAIRRPIVDAWLAEHQGQWDVFAGLIALVHPATTVLAVDEVEGQTFVTLDRMTSMVHNIYTSHVLTLLAQWNPSDTNSDENTIDRYLQLKSGLRVVVILPFLVGHREELDSSIWGFNNTQYSDLILQSQSELQQAVSRFKAASLA